MEENVEYLTHTDAVGFFNNDLYDSIFTDSNIVSKKKAIKFGDDKYYGYLLEKGNIIYFCPDTYIDKLPFKILKSDEIDYKTDVYTFIKQIETIIIPAEKRMSVRELIDMSPAFSHSNDKHFLLHKIISFASYVDRVNYRVCTNAGFGKDSVVNIFANLYGATFAKLEYSLKNTSIILNEMGNLKADDKMNMQEFLLASGAYFNVYNKRSRKSAGTQEAYDISKTSIVIFYNLPEYYKGKAQEYFDQMFTKAVCDRFIPFVLSGSITTKFDKVIDAEKIATENKEVYKAMIATINYFKKNILKTIKWNYPDNLIFPEELNRYDRSFKILAKYVAEYSDTQEEFNELITELYESYKKYATLITKEKK